jgi:hypothetical protein
MNSTTTDQFWMRYAALPAEAKKRAREAYMLFLSDPYHLGPATQKKLMVMP